MERGMLWLFWLIWINFWFWLFEEVDWLKVLVLLFWFKGFLVCCFNVFWVGKKLVKEVDLSWIVFLCFEWGFVFWLFVVWDVLRWERIYVLVWLIVLVVFWLLGWFWLCWVVCRVLGLWELGSCVCVVWEDLVVWWLFFLWEEMCLVRDDFFNLFLWGFLVVVVLFLFLGLSFWERGLIR